jgi:Tol biopolymer transport system component
MRRKLRIGPIAPGAEHFPRAPTGQRFFCAVEEGSVHEGDPPDPLHQPHPVDPLNLDGSLGAVAVMNAGRNKTVLDVVNSPGHTRAVNFSSGDVMRLAAVSVLVWALGACVQPPAPVAPATSEVIHSHDATSWFEEYFARATSVAPDGRRLVFQNRGSVALIDVEHGALPMDAWAAVDEVTGVVIRPSGDVAVRGRRGGQAGWFERDRTGRLRSIDVPATVVPRWSEDGVSIAYQEASGTQWMLHIVAREGRRALPIPARANAVAWYPDASALLVMLPEDAGLSSLQRVDARTGEMRVIARGLDAEPSMGTTMAVAPDGRRAYVALASARSPLPEERHDAHADRDLDIYELDLTTGARRVVASTTGDDTTPLLAGGNLSWTSIRVEASVIAIPIEGGALHSVVAGAQAPTWHPNGRQLGYFFGDWRLADWALNWDGGAVQVDSAIRPLGLPGPLVIGYHEDFPPVWSPNGRWIAYHSHRSPRAVASYGEPGATDDIYLRAAGAPATAEVRLTDFGWEAGSPDWSPDGTRLVFTSFDRAKDTRRSLPFLITLDTATGRATSTGVLPLPAAISSAEMVAWSPAGEEIAIEEAMGSGRHALWVIRSDGTAPRKLVDYPMRTYGGVDWTQDGKTLIYSALTGNRMQLFAIPAAGGLPRRLTTEPAHILHPQVSPDGRWIAATRLVHTIQVRRMAFGPRTEDRGRGLDSSAR